MAFICQMHGGQRDGVESRRVHENQACEKVMDWLAEPSDPILVGVGAKIMSFIVNHKVSHSFMVKLFGTWEPRPTNVSKYHYLPLYCPHQNFQGSL